jgi:hypothetical protein
MRVRKPIVATKFLAWKSKLVGFRVAGYAFFPWIFVNRECPTTPVGKRIWNKTVNHESIHWYQYVELLYVGFLLLYGLNYIINRFTYKGHYEAYRNVVFEREAYANAYTADYLPNIRKWHSYMLYFGKKYEYKKPKNSKN